MSNGSPHAVFDLEYYRELRHTWIRNGRVRVSQRRRTDPDNSREPSSNRNHRGCMDARLDPAKFSGLTEGDCHSSATPAAAPARMPFGPWSFLTNCLEPANGLSFIILIAAWSCSRMKPCPNCSRRAWRRRDWKRSRKRPR